MYRKIKSKIKSVLIYFGIYKPKCSWPILSAREKQFLIKNVNINTSLKTIKDIKDTINKKQKGAYMRFGDGDIFLMLGKNEMLQKANKKMAKEIKDAMIFKDGVLHKGLPIHSSLFGYEKGMKENMHLVSDDNAIKFLASTYKFVDVTNIYSPVALHYLATFNHDACLDFLQFLRNTNPIFVGNKNIKSELIKKLFGDIHIKTPAENSYLEIDRIENELINVLKKKQDEFVVVVIAMGCAGRVLQKRILKKRFNVYLFDFGSLLDAFNNDNTRLWIDLAGGTYNLMNILNKLD
jgi:hypothetical protein